MLFVLTVSGLILTSFIVWAEFTAIPIGAFLAVLELFAGQSCERHSKPDTYSLDKGGVKVGMHRAPYPAEFRARLVDLVKAGRTPEELAQEFEPCVQTILNWVAQAEIDAGVRHDGLTTAERQKLTRLRRESAAKNGARHTHGLQRAT